MSRASLFCPRRELRHCGSRLPQSGGRFPGRGSDGMSVWKPARWAGAVMGQLRRVAPRRPVRDAIRAGRVEKNTVAGAEAHAAAAEAVALAKGCEKRVGAFGEIVARAAGAAEIRSEEHTSE